MRLFKGFSALLLFVAFSSYSVTAFSAGQDYSSGGDDTNRKILKQGVLGAATGAIAAEASGGKAGQGALVGAGTNVIGGALLDTLTGPSTSQPKTVYVQQAPVYAQQAPQYQQSYPVQSQGNYSYSSQPQPVYAQPQPVYVQQQQAEDPTKKILKQGLLGAATGGIAASASGGKAGKGALIGAGTSVIGGALLDSLMGSGQPQQQQVVYAQPQPQYYQQQPQQYQQQYQQQQQYPSSYSSSTQPKKKIVRKYDSDGNVISEEEVWE